MYLDHHDGDVGGQVEAGQVVDRAVGFVFHSRIVRRGAAGQKTKTGCLPAGDIRKVTFWNEQSRQPDDKARRAFRR